MRAISRRLPRTLLTMAMMSAAAAMPAAAVAIGEDAAPAAAGATGEPSAKPPRPLIERSLVLAPVQAGDFVLEEAKDYPGQPEAGVGLSYRHPDFPEVMFSVFVYPAGRVDPTQLWPVVVAHLGDELRHVERQGSYSALEIDAAEEFDLQRIDSDGSVLAARPAAADTVPAADAGASDDALGIAAASAAAIAEVRAANDPDIGRRIAIRHDTRHGPHRSAAFLMLRSLFLHKGRVTGPAELDQDSFDRLANHAMATILPRVQVRNAGGCNELTVYFDPKDGDDAGNARALAVGLARSQEQARLENCAPTLDTTVPDGWRGVELDLAALWQQRGGKAPRKTTDGAAR